jgi:hypothetical protein
MRIRLVIPAVVLALSLGVAPFGGATPSTQATATSRVLSFTQAGVRTADGKTTYAFADAFVWMGGIRGITVESGTYTVHSPKLATGRAAEVCPSCTIGGRTGSFRAALTFTSNATLTQIYTGHFTFTEAAGGLAGLHGKGTFNARGLYFSYHFGP